MFHKVRDNFMIKMSEKDFDKVISCNLKGTFLVTQAASKGLIEHFPSFDGSDPLKSYASIINISSIIGQAYMKVKYVIENNILLLNFILR